jgi:transcriptional regulator with XRE-family HTH domain
MRRRSKLTDLSKQVIDYFCSKIELTQSQIADLLEVDKSFISRVRNGERELSSFHLERLAGALGVDVGVMLIGAAKSSNKKLRPELQEIADLCEKAILTADRAIKELRSEAVRKQAS